MDIDCDEHSLKLTEICQKLYDLVDEFRWDYEYCRGCLCRVPEEGHSENCKVVSIMQEAKKLLEE